MWGAHLLCAREGVIEAGYIGHNGLLIRPQRTHDVYASPSRTERCPQRKETEREREAEWSQSYPKLHGPCSLQDVRTREEGGGKSPSLPPPPPHPATPTLMSGGGGDEDKFPLEEGWGTLEPQVQGRDTNTEHLLDGASPSLNSFTVWSSSFLHFGSFSSWEWWEITALTSETQSLWPPLWELHCSLLGQTT